MNLASLLASLIASFALLKLACLSNLEIKLELVYYIDKLRTGALRCS